MGNNATERDIYAAKLRKANGEFHEKKAIRRRIWKRRAKLICWGLSSTIGSALLILLVAMLINTAISEDPFEARLEKVCTFPSSSLFS